MWTSKGPHRNRHPLVKHSRSRLSCRCNSCQGQTRRAREEGRLPKPGCLTVASRETATRRIGQPSTHHWRWCGTGWPGAVASGASSKLVTWPCVRLNVSAWTFQGDGESRSLSCLRCDSSTMSSKQPHISQIHKMQTTHIYLNFGPQQLTRMELHEKVRKLLGRTTPSRLWLKCSPKFKLRRSRGSSTPSRLWLKFSLNFKLRRTRGSSTPSRLWLKLLPNVKLWRSRGKTTPSRLWLKLPPNVKLRRSRGSSTPSRLWLKFSLNFKLRRTRGSSTPSRLWLKLPPNVKLWRSRGKSTPSRLWLKLPPNVKLWRSRGKSTPSRLWLKLPPNVTRLWLKLLPNVKLWRSRGKSTPSRLWLKFSPNVKGQALKTAWKFHFSQALVEWIANSKPFKTSGKLQKLSRGNTCYPRHPPLVIGFRQGLAIVGYNAMQRTHL